MNETKEWIKTLLFVLRPQDRPQERVQYQQWMRSNAEDVVVMPRHAMDVLLFPGWMLDAGRKGMERSRGNFEFQ